MYRFSRRVACVEAWTEQPCLEALPSSPAESQTPRAGSDFLDRTTTLLSPKSPSPGEVPRCSPPDSLHGYDSRYPSPLSPSFDRVPCSSAGRFKPRFKLGAPSSPCRNHTLINLDRPYSCCVLCEPFMWKTGSSNFCKASCVGLQNRLKQALT